MSEKKASPIWTTLLEVGPVVLFFLIFISRKGQTITFAGQEYSSLIQATAVFVPVMVFATVLGYFINGHVSRVQLLTLVLVVIFGAMTVIFNNESFFKMKPTLIYLLFGSALSYGFWRGQNYLQNLMGERMPMSDEGWNIIARRLAIFFFALAVLNELIWRTQTTETWVYFKTFGLSAAIFIFMISQYPVLAKHGSLDDEQD